MNATAVQSYFLDFAAMVKMAFKMIAESEQVMP